MEYWAVARWLALLLLIGAAAWPIAARLVGNWPDRGAALAIPVALAVIGLTGYWVGHIRFGGAPIAAALVLAGGGVLVGRRLDDRLPVRRGAEAALVFVAAFLFLVAIRAVDPAVHPLGGEKFLDFGLLKAILRADRLPPEDMWFAGEPVRYYYGGHLIAAILTRLAVVPARFGYNLALATTYAALVTAAYGVAGAIGAANDADRRLSGGVAAVAVGLASNFETPARVALWSLPDRIARTIASAANLPTVADWTPTDFSYWSASRVVRLGDGFLPTEFPLFAWLNGDLHAHMSSTPFLLLTLGLLYAYARTPADRRLRRRLLVFGAVPLLGGLIAVVNTWSFPAVAGLTALTLVLAPTDPRSLLPAFLRRGPLAVPSPLRERASSTGRPTFQTYQVMLRHELIRIAVATAIAVVGLALAAVTVLPFWLGTASSRPLAVLPDRTALGELLLVHGPFLLALVPYLAARCGPSFRRSMPSSTRRGWIGAMVLAVGLVAAGTIVGAAAVPVFGGLLAVAWIGRRTGHLGFETVPIVAGAGLVVLVEFVYVDGGAAPGRFNTVFKTYMQVWVLWSVAAGVAIAGLVRRLEGSAMMAWNPNDWRVPELLRLGGRVVVALLLCSTLLYGWFALSAHFARADDPTLDATAFVDERHPGEARAIDWVDARSGTPTIVTAAPGGYRWQPSEGKGASAPSSLTGVPTVAGWFHERGYRGPGVFERRVGHVRTMYEGPRARQRALFERYDVAYVYVGPAERNRYSVDLPPLPVAHASGDVRIYRVVNDTAGE